MSTLSELFAEKDERPAKNGWAPGSYIRKCFTCRKEFIGDKRAVTCARCAYESSVCPKCGWRQDRELSKLKEEGPTAACENCGHEYELGT